MDLIQTLEELITEGESLVPQGGHIFEGYNLKLQPDYLSWRLQALSVIRDLGQDAGPILKDLEADKDGPYFLKASASRVLGALKGARAIVQRTSAGNTANNTPTGSESHVPAGSRKVFLVHGQNEAMVHQAARLLERLELEPIILFEQPAKGQTIIEKLEQNSSVQFAVVLLTPDDIGKAVKDTGDPRPRARQNVIFELGYFVAKLRHIHAYNAG